MSHSVGELAKLTNVSVRTLHHYDAIGLLSPSERTRAGHRRYGPDDVQRLHRILLYRELGFELAAIAEILADTTVDPREHLRRQHALLTDQLARTTTMIKGVEAMMNKERFNLTDAELRDVFAGFDAAKLDAEAEERWGDTDAYRESRQRTSRYNQQQWQTIKAEAAAIIDDFAALMQNGTAATSQQALDVAERHRAHVSRWFYDCGPEIHRGLGEMFVADPRFAATYENRAAGLAAYVSTAIRANADRA